MIKLTNEGYVFVSKKGIMYDLLEGMSIGAEKQYTSDIIFIFLYDADYNVKDNFVGYLFGAGTMQNDIKGYEETIGKIVDEYEEKNFKQGGSNNEQ